MIEWSPFLIKQIARRRVVFFLGAGVSMNSINAAGRRPKGWNKFLEDSSSSLSIPDQKLIKKLMKQNDYLMVCDILKRKLGRAEFNTIMEDEYLHPNYLKAPIHERIFELDSRIVITPNFDKIYESYAQSVDSAIKTKVYFDEDIASSLSSDNRMIIKTHGTIDTPDKLIFTKSEYAQARIKYSTFYEILEALALTHTFVFIGAGLNDPDIRLLLEDTFFKHTPAMPHYFLIQKKMIHQEEKEVIQETTNMKFVEYSPADNHIELTDSLQNLVVLVEEKRIDLQTTMNW